MTSEQRLVGFNLLMVGVAGLSLGLGVSAIGAPDLLPVTSLLFLAAIAEWLEVRFGPLGGFTLGPIVAFAALWTRGPGPFLAVGLLPPLVLRALSRRFIAFDLVSIGPRALALWTGQMAYTVILGLMGTGASPATVGFAARASSFVVFWTAQVVLQALMLQVHEGIRLSAALGQLVRQSWLHGAILAIAAIVLSFIDQNFGLLIMGFGVVMLVEAYYPWRLLGEQEGILLTSLQMMAQAVDLKDPYTSNHSQRVAKYAVRIARAMDLPENEVERVRIGALMHDIGKIGISGRIIRKPGKLTTEEQALMRQHSSVSAGIIQHLEVVGEAADMVRHHHENWDGTGYPNGLVGSSIPLGSRVIFVADAFDALVTDRPYRKGASREEALSVIKANSGTQFDPTAVAALERIIDLL